MDSSTPADSIIAIASIVIAIATIAQVFTTYLIARYVNKSSTDTERLSTTRHINQQWQRFNLLTLQNREFCDILEEMGYDPEGIARIRKRYVIFYILNILYDIYYARPEGRVIEGFADKMTRDHIQLLAQSSEELNEILDGARGYDPDFVQEIKSILKESENR